MLNMQHLNTHVATINAITKYTDVLNKNEAWIESKI
jgi:hypothetical protein